MLRKFSETFTATHFTLLAMTAMIVPGTVYATVSSQAVSVTDPSTGVQALVDNGRRVSVYDPIAGYQNNPVNFVKAYGTCSSSGNSFSYAPPSGKALIVKSVDMTYYGATTGNDNFIYVGTNGAIIAGLDSTEVANFKNSDLGNGATVRNGAVVTLGCGSTGTYLVFLTGYLVPAALVPATETGQSVEPATQLVKNGKRI